MDKKRQKASRIGVSTNLQPMDDSHRTGYVKTVWDRHFHLVPGSNCNNWTLIKQHLRFWIYQASYEERERHLLLSSAKSNLRSASPIWWVVITCGSPASSRVLTSGARVALYLPSKKQSSEVLFHSKNFKPMVIRPNIVESGSNKDKWMQPAWQAWGGHQGQPASQARAHLEVRSSSSSDYYRCTLFQSYK